MWEVRRDLVKFSGAVFRGAKVDVGTDSGGFAVAFRNSLGEVLGIFLAHEVDGASAKAASGHASAAKTWQTFGGFDHDVEFAATDFIEITQAGVRLAH